MLKERIVQLLKEAPEIWEPGCDGLSTSRGYPEFNLQGLILKAAGYHLQSPDRTYSSTPKLPLNAPQLYKTWAHYEMTLKVLGPDLLVAPLARQVWAEEYGDQVAQELPFYDEEDYLEEKLGSFDDYGNRAYDGSDTTEWFWDDLGSVSPDDVIELFETGLADGLNKWEKRKHDKRKR
jgi:hypothetical protein